MPILAGIVSRNRAEILPKALDSALNQSAPNIRVAVIDDASSDGTAGLREYYRQVDWKFRTEPLGYMSARNEFMAQEGFDYFVSLDDDSWFLCGDEIAEALQHFDRDPALAAVAFDIVSPDRPNVNARATPVHVGMFIGCGHMLRLSAVRKVGAYVPTPGGYGGEEKDLCLRLINAGFSIIRLPGVHVWHDKTPVARDIAWQHRSGVCNDLTMAVRRTPFLLLPVIIPGKMIRHIVFAWRHSLLAPCIAGLALFAWSLPSVWRWRKPVRYVTLRKFAQLARE